MEKDFSSVLTARVQTRSVLGFTLIELMVAVTLLSILLALAVPSYQTLVTNNRLATQTNLLITVLTLARSEAVKRGARVTVCKSANQATCTTAGAWTQGWIAFTDDGDGVVETGSGESILQVQAALTGGLSITGDGFEDYVSYVATGEIRKNELEGGGLHNGTLSVCHTESGTAREVTVNRVGRIRLIEEAECP